MLASDYPAPRFDRSKTVQQHLSNRSIFNSCLELLKPRMDLLQRSVYRVAWSLNGAKSGSATGKTLSIALRNVNQSDQAHPLHSL